MKDKDLQSYLNKRLSEYQVDDLPDFDSFFTAEELTPPRPKWRIWPWLSAAASVAAVLALLFVFPWSEPASQVEEMAQRLDAQVLDSPKNLPESSPENALESSSSNPLATESSSSNPSATESSSLSTAEAKPIVSKTASTELFAQAALPEAEATELSEQGYGFSQDSDISNAQTQPSSAQPISSTAINSPDYPKAESQAKVYERSIEEAYAEARQQKAASRKAKRRVSYGLSFSQNNGLLASTSSLNQNAAMNTSPLMAASSQYASVSLRAAVSKNEWKVPDNLSAGQLKAYTPIFHYPIAFGLSLDIPLANRLSLQTALTYTYLRSEIHGNQEDASRWTIDQALHYVGIPLQVAVDIVDQRSWRLYVGLGGGLEKGICGVQQAVLRQANTEHVSRANTIQPIYGLQPYTSASFGLSYTLASRWQVYLQPAVNYYFDTDQPMSIRTKKPFSLNLGAGVRLCL